MAKSPAFQFYPGDWLRNDVSGCSLEAQGLWLRMMIIMHDAQVYGQLILNNEQMSAEFIAKKIGISRKKYLNLLAELDFAGVINRHENGVIYSGRMERDERKRQLDRERQAEKYRRDHPESEAEEIEIEDESSRDPHAEPHAPSSSSSSPSIKEEEIHIEAEPIFSGNWQWPLKPLFDAFPELVITPANLATIELDVGNSDIDRAAWHETVATYRGNYDPELNRYDPRKVGTLLRVFKDTKAKMKRDLEKTNGTNRQNNNGHKQTPGEIIENRPYRTANTD